MRGARFGPGRTVILAVALSAAALIDRADAQTTPEKCSARKPPTVGAVVGLSSPYFEMESGLYAGRGPEVAGRFEVPLVGPLRARIEGATAWWDVKQTTDLKVGTMSARHLVGLLSVSLGRGRACGRVSVGGGLYAASFNGITLRRPGWAIGFGLDAPVKPRHFVQIDATFHLIRIGPDAPLAAMTASPNLSLLFGWAYQF